MCPVSRQNRINPQSRFFARFAGGLLVVLLALAAYSSSLRGDFIWDDDDYVQKNVLLRSPGGLWMIWAEPSATPQYYPLVHSTFWIEYHLWGLWPMGYKLVNLALHTASALLLWRILGKLAVPGAFFAAAIWAMHPVNLESVAWITERKNVLSGLFYLLSLAAYLRFDEVQNPESEVSTPKSSPGWYLTALALFACALLSKTVTATLPVVLGLLLWRRHGRLVWRMILPLLPLVLIGAAMGLTTAWIERAHVGAVGREFEWTGLQSIMIAGWAVLFYLWKLFWPVDLSFIYPRWAINAWGTLHLLGFALVVLALAASWLLRRRIGRGPFVAAGCFVVTLFPALGFLNVYPMRYSFVADHFQYLASIAPIALIAGIAATWLGSRPARRIVAAAVLVLSGILTWRQGRIYESRFTLFTDVIQKNPRSWMAYSNLGHVFVHRAEAFQREGNTQQSAASQARAVGYYEKALEVGGDFPEPWWNVGIARLQEGNLAEAKALFERAIQVDQTFAQAYMSLGNVAKAQGNASLAELNYEAAIRLYPGYAEAMFNLGTLRESLGRMEDAIRAYEAAVRVQPAYVNAHFNLGNCYRLSSRPDQAIAQYEICVNLDPAHWTAWMNLGATWLRVGELTRARRCFAEVLRLRPDYAPAHQAMEQTR